MRAVAWVLGMLLAAGCASAPKVLVFGQVQNVGLSISGSAPEQRAEMTLGYKDYNIAVIPTDVSSEASDGFKDALSVLGQFDLNAKNEGASQGVGLGKFFATGLAARVLAEGFACKLGHCPGAGADAAAESAAGAPPAGSPNP